MAVTADKERRQQTSWRSLTAIIDFAVASHARAIAVLLVASLVSFLPGFFSTPPIDRDEARFAQATKQMVESGDYVDIRFQDEVRYKKPVGIYWLQAAVVKTASALGFQRAPTTIWLYRIPSLIGAIGAVLLTYWAALAFVSRRAAVLAGLMMASCVLLGVERLLAKTDAMLLLATVAAMGAMARAYLRAPGEEPTPADALDARCGVLDLDRGRRAAEGAFDRDDRRAHRRCACRGRSLLPLAPGAQATARHCMACDPGAALVPRDHRPERRDLLCRVRSGRIWPASCSPARSPMAHRPAATSCCSGSRSGRAQRWRPWRRRRSMRRDASPRPSSCWLGWCRRGSCSSWW